MFGFLSFSELGVKVADGIDMLPQGIDMVVGIPRSGMIPAYMIALFRNVSVLDLPSFLADRTPENGIRRLGYERKSALQANWILLVDDSIDSGRAMREAVQRVRASGFMGKVTTCVVVSEPSRHLDVDIHFCEIPQPRLFEWNAFHHDLVEEACFDLDGVLCVDPTEDVNDDGPRYREFLKNAQPRFRPTRTIGNIVSARLEKYRELTENWLSENQISYRRLHLIDLPRAQDRIRLRAHCTHKAKVYLETGASIFFESNSCQAKEIARLTSKPVLCTDEMQVYLPGIHLKSVTKLVKWRFATPVGRLKARLRSVRSSFGAYRKFFFRLQD